jgi:hypothetical protein
MSNKLFAAQFYNVVLTTMNNRQKVLIDVENEGKELIRKRDERRNYHCEFCDVSTYLIPLFSVSFASNFYKY